MQTSARTPTTIRKILPAEYARAGALTVEAYAGLAGMPRPDEQPEYYGMLHDVATRAAKPSFSIYVAVSDAGALLGSVDFIADVKHYGSGGTAGDVPDAAGIRLLAVSPDARGQGIGRALTQFCIDQARSLGRSRVILHTTRAMQKAWKMYESMGFERCAELDFRQGNLEVFGFVKPLPGRN